VIDAAPDLVWFFWPVTFALVTAPTVCRLVRRRAWGAAAGAVMSLALPVVPLVVAIPVQCSDGDPVLDLRIPALGVGLLAVVAWLASIVTLAVGCGDTREPLAWHLGLAAVVLVAGAVTGAVRGVAGPRHQKTPAGGGRR
jgi:hypothetical protein